MIFRQNYHIGVATNYILVNLCCLIMVFSIHIDSKNKTKKTPLHKRIKGRQVTTRLGHLDG